MSILDSNNNNNNKIRNSINFQNTIISIGQDNIENDNTIFYNNKSELKKYKQNKSMTIQNPLAEIK